MSRLSPSNTVSPYVHRAKAWLAFRAGQGATAVVELELALADSCRQAPEIRLELEATRALFLAAMGR